MSALKQVLAGIEAGDAEAAARLLPMVYDELRRLAAHRLAQEAPGQTLQATALVHEAWLRLGGSEGPAWQGRGHFFAAAAEAMRRILIDRARRRAAQRHGGAVERLQVDTLDSLPESVPDESLLAVHDALERLAVHDAAKAELVKLRFFIGLTIEQAAEVLGWSTPTAKRHWAYARAWLYREIKRSSA